MAFGKPVRGSTGGTDKYGTKGGYPQSKPYNGPGSVSFSGGVAEALYGLFIWFVDYRAQRREAGRCALNSVGETDTSRARARAV